MNFLLRNASLSDIRAIYSLVNQFNLLNLPPKMSLLEEKLVLSEASFAGIIPKEKAEYLFLIEDLKEKKIVGTSLIMAKHGTPEAPHHCFKLSDQFYKSSTIGIERRHKVMELVANTNGPTEIGGLLIDKAYRKHPMRLGLQVSFVRFFYMALFTERFEKEVLCELTPPLENGCSPFWEAIGKRLTGLEYKEADELSHRDRRFIGELFPKVPIFLSLLSKDAQASVGQVALETKPAKKLLESIGFKELPEVDPFDGGPHLGVSLPNIVLVKNKRSAFLQKNCGDAEFSEKGFILVPGEENYFQAVFGNFSEKEGVLFLPENFPLREKIMSKQTVDFTQF